MSDPLTMGTVRCGIVHFTAVVISAIFTILPPAVYADGVLDEVVAAALEHAPELQVAAAEHRANREIVPKSRANLLPSLQLSGSYSSNSTTEKYQNTSFERNTDYTSDSQSLSLTQPLYRKEAWAAYRQGQLSVGESESRYRLAEQQVLFQVIDLFGQKLHYEIALQAARRELEARQSRLHLLVRMSQSGQADIVEMVNAEADLLQQETTLLEQQNRLDEANLLLERMTERVWSPYQLDEEKDLDSCRKEMVEYVQGAVAQFQSPDTDIHPEISAALRNVDIALMEVDKQYGRHYPTVDFVASMSRGSSASEVTIGSDLETSVIGVQLTVPLYSGGEVSASVREALALQEKAEAELRQTRLKVRGEQQSARAELLLKIKRIDADRKGVQAAALGLDREQKKLRQGIGSEVDFNGARAELSTRRAELMSSVVELVRDYARFYSSFGLLDRARISPLSAIVGRCVIPVS